MVLFYVDVGEAKSAFDQQELANQGGDKNQSGQSHSIYIYGNNIETCAAKSPEEAANPESALLICVHALPTHKTPPSRCRSPPGHSMEEKIE